MEGKEFAKKMKYQVKLNMARNVTFVHSFHEKVIQIKIRVKFSSSFESFCLMHEF